MSEASYAELVVRAQQRLATAGLREAGSANDASVLARSWLGWDQARWFTDKALPAPESFRVGFESWVARRLAREPVAYIVGHKEFYGRPFIVTPDVLIPRPETELIVEVAGEEHARRERAVRPIVDVLDVGTGSGCLAVTLALEWEHMRVTATDVSTGALAVAGANVRYFGVESRVSLVNAALTAGRTAAFDLVVANPPYVPTADRGRLSPDVRDHEPALALFGGADGLEVIRALAPAAALALRPGGVMIVEVGAGQASDAAGLLATAGLWVRDIRPDLAGIPRVVVAERPGPPYNPEA